MNYFITIIILFLLTSSALTYSKSDNFEIKHADSLETENKQINVKGNVVINYKDANVEAPKCTVESNEKGEPQKAVFTGRAKLKLKDKTLEADKITISIKDEIIYAEGNTLSNLKDKKNNSIIISSDFQELHWNGEDAHARGNLKTTYQDTNVTSEEVKIIYKGKRPDLAIFFGASRQSTLEQPTNTTIADKLIFDLTTKNIQGIGNVKGIIWPDEKIARNKQSPIHLNTEDLYIDNKSGIITANSETELVMIDYEVTKGESHKAFLYKNKESGRPEKIVFKGQANVTQEDKQLTSEEVVFNFNDKKLISKTQTNIRPKTFFFRKE